LARINLRKFIAEHYKGGVTARDVVREAVTNSIHAGGTKISVDLRFSEKQTELLDLPSERAGQSRLTYGVAKPLRMLRK
jgi:aspartate oxidase